MGNVGLELVHQPLKYGCKINIGVPTFQLSLFININWGVPGLLKYVSASAHKHPYSKLNPNT